MDKETVSFNVLRNALYHTAMRRFYERCNRWFSFFLVLLGATAITNGLGSLDISHTAVGIAVAALSAAQLTFNFGGNASLHQQLQRDYYYLLAEMEAKIDYTDEDIARWYSGMVRISGNEPPTMRAIDAKAYNDAIDALEKDEGDIIIIPSWRVLFGYFYASEGYRFLKRHEVNRGKATAD